MNISHIVLGIYYKDRKVIDRMPKRVYICISLLISLEGPKRE